MPPTDAREIQGWMNDEEFAWLSEQASQMESVAEIGCWRGRSTFMLLSSCKGPVYAVDHFKGSDDELDGQHVEALTKDIHAEFLANVGHFSNLRVLQIDSIEAAKIAPDVDMVFIDGTHTVEAVRADIQAWLPKTRRIICGHDFPMEQVAMAVVMELGTNITVHARGGIWCYRIPPPDAIIPTMPVPEQTLIPSATEKSPLPTWEPLESADAIKRLEARVAALVEYIYAQHPGIDASEQGKEMLANLLSA